jgi:hypothetical protein
MVVFSQILMWSLSVPLSTWWQLSFPTAPLSLLAFVESQMK